MPKHSLETTELKLKTTPTGGVDASHSPYYRRLLSAGYKGFLQGSIGGGALYGTFGLVIGTALALFAAPIGAIGAAAFWLIPAAAGVGVAAGASTFGHIGSTAAINAESADLSEQRRYLLDRYYDLPEGPEGDREAEAIKQELLKRQIDNERPAHFFHWKTLVIGATVGALVALAAFSPVGVAALVDTGFMHAFSALATKIGLTSFIGTAAGATGVLGVAFGALAGALTGATIGIDRYYIRKWFDHTEGVVHSSSHQESAMMERSQQFERIKEAHQEDQKTKQLMLMSRGEQSPAVEESGPKAPVAAKPPVASLDKPTHQISAARREGLMEIQKAMGVPVV